MNQSTSTRQYYLAQFFFWSAYFLLNMVFVRVSVQWHPIYLVIFLVLSGLLFLATHALRWIYRKRAGTWTLRRTIGHLVWVLPLLALLIQWVLFSIIFFAINLFAVDVAGAQRSSFGGFITYAMNTWIMLVLWCTVYLFKVESRKRREAEIAHWKLQSEVKEAELQFLRSQINSHFLFNALNNLRSLIREDAERARSGLNDLAALLRGLLHVDPTKKVRLRDELEWVKGYLALEALQFENRLRTEFNIDENLLNQELPPMILQTLVENAVKHGIAARRDGGVIIISARQLGDKKWQLIVTNPGAERVSTHHGNGIGLRNTRQRLALAYADQASLTLDVNDVVTATVELPL